MIISPYPSIESSRYFNAPVNNGLVFVVCNMAYLTRKCFFFNRPLRCKNLDFCDLEQFYRLPWLQNMIEIWFSSLILLLFLFMFGLHSFYLIVVKCNMWFCSFRISYHQNSSLHFIREINDTNNFADDSVVS